MTETLTDIRNQFTYKKYMDLLFILAENDETTGESTTEHIAATKINAQRFRRIEKHCDLNPELKEAISQFNRECLWIVIVETWCGDGAQCVPVIAKIAEQSSTIELKLVLRDENPDLMASYLTNGTRSIPKLICIDKATNMEIGTWGPRPHAIQKMAMDFRRNNPDATHEEFVTNLHLCYARDRTKSIQEEFTHLINSWNL